MWYLIQKGVEAAFVDKHFNLVLDCKQGSRKACHELYRLYSKSMLNVAHRIVGNIEEAEDIIQEAFLDVFTRINQFRQETTFGLWIKQIVINRSINLIRKRKLEWVPMSDEVLEDIADEEGYDDEELQYKVAQIKEALKRLPEGYRVVLSLYLLEGYDHEEIGEILNITEGTSRIQFMRAKRKLIELLNNDTCYKASFQCHLSKN